MCICVSNIGYCFLWFILLFILKINEVVPSLKLRTILKTIFVTWPPWGLTGNMPAENYACELCSAVLHSLNLNCWENYCFQITACAYSVRFHLPSWTYNASLAVSLRKWSGRKSGTLLAFSNPGVALHGVASEDFQWQYGCLSCWPSIGLDYE